MVVSVVIPCLNEAETIAECVTRARRVLGEAGLEGEVIMVQELFRFESDGAGPSNGSLRPTGIAAADRYRVGR